MNFLVDSIKTWALGHYSICNAKPKNTKHPRAKVYFTYSHSAQVPLSNCYSRHWQVFMHKIKFVYGQWLLYCVRHICVHVLSSHSSLMNLQARDWKTLEKCQKVIQRRGGDGKYCGVAVNSEGLLAVTDDTDKRVHLLSEEGALVRSIGEGELGNDLFGVAFDIKGNVWVANRTKTNVVELSQEGEVLQTIDLGDTDSVQRRLPSGVSVSQQGQIYVCDYGSHCVAVHDEKGKCQFTFGSKGKGPGCFDGPCDVTFGSDELVYVSDQQNKRVCVWHGKGTFQRDFPTKYPPTFIAATSDNHLLITSHRSDTVMVYTSGGELVHEFGGRGSERGELEEPYGICIDDNGLVFVVDRGNKRIQVF